MKQTCNILSQFLSSNYHSSVTMWFQQFHKNTDQHIWLASEETAILIGCFPMLICVATSDWLTPMSIWLMSDWAGGSKVGILLLCNHIMLACLPKPDIPLLPSGNFQKNVEVVAFFPHLVHTCARDLLITKGDKPDRDIRSAPHKSTEQCVYQWHEIFGIAAGKTHQVTTNTHD